MEQEIINNNQNENTEIVEVKKKRMGRPPGSCINKPKIQFDNQLYKIVENAFNMGQTIPQVAGILGINEKTLDNYLKKDEKLKNIYKNGKNRTHAIVYGKLLDNIESGCKASIFFYLKTQCGFREVQRNELAISNDNPNNVALLRNSFEQNILGITVNHNNTVTDSDKLITDKNKMVGMIKNDSSTA